MKIILSIILLVMTSIYANSQCDKKIKWSGSKGEMYDTNGGGLLDTKLDSIFLVTSAQKINLRFQSDDKELEGSVTDNICDWKEPYKNGKSVYHANVNVDGLDSKATFVIEAKDGKTTLTVDIEQRQGRKFVIYFDKHEEIE